MIQAVIFDMDGTLVQTEPFKALSYAKAVRDLRPGEFSEDQAIEAFMKVVGRSRREVAKSLLDRFGLEQVTAARMERFGVSRPWQAFVQVRMQHYQGMLADPETIRKNRLLKALDLSDAFDFVASRDDLENGKPDPEIYLLVSRELETSPSHCLVIKDSASGVQAALATGMWCLAVTTEFTQKAIHNKKLLDHRWIVDDPRHLLATARQLMQEAAG